MIPHTCVAFRSSNLTRVLRLLSMAGFAHARTQSRKNSPHTKRSISRSSLFQSHRPPQYPPNFSGIRLMDFDNQELSDHLHLLRDRQLSPLLSCIGGGLVSLRLHDSYLLAAQSVAAIAATCTRLRELDLGWVQKIGQLGLLLSCNAYGNDCAQIFP